MTFRQAMLLDCPVCETERTDGAVFCGKCGWKLPPRTSGKPHDDYAKAMIAASMVIRPEHLDFDRI